MSLRLAIPSEGALAEGAERFMASCGLKVSRASSRRYTAAVPAMPGLVALYQRQSDITSEIDGESADVGLVGLDRFRESRREGGDTILIVEDLGFGKSSLELAVPDAWVDVTTVYDLADLAMEFKNRGRELRIATKYPRLVKRFLNRRGINYFSMVHASGGLEAAPVMGYADMIADITATGVTLRENRLRPLLDGAVIQSQAALVGNARLLAVLPERLSLVRELLERVEASLRARRFQRISANIPGESPESVARMVMSRRELAGIEGPTVANVFTDDGLNWFNVQVVVRKNDLIAAVDHFRSIGGSGITVNEASYAFRSRCESFDRLMDSLEPYRNRQEPRSGPQ